MKVLITGAAGFLGSRVARQLLDGVAGLPPVSALIAVDTTACPIADSRIESRVGTIESTDFIRSILDENVDVIYHMAAVLSGQAEAEFDLGMRVNVDATRGLLERCRRLTKPPRFIFTSTVAVFGGELPDVVPEQLETRPQSSYGTAKAIGELLVNEYSRKGIIDGVACRLPTVAIRPGAPNSAMSSFVSGIIREPLAGVDAVCPVPLDTRLWISAPAVVTANLVHAARLQTSTLGDNRTITLPGLSARAGEMLASLERLGGAEARAHVRCEPDPRIMRVVCTWPGAFDVTRALRLGFVADRDVDSIVAQFIAERTR